MGYRTTARLGALAAAVALSALAGCQRMVLNAEHMSGGLVIVLPGVDGRAPYDDGVCHALSDAGVPMAVELYDWTAPLGPLFNQCAMLRNRDVASQLAKRILEYRRAHPDRPVYLIGHSGGTAIAVWAAESMPIEQKIDGIVLLASSLSPGYSLSRALGRTRQGIVNFYSPHDVALLGLGTCMIGTMDRQHTQSAGLVGFEMPADPDGDEPGGTLVQVAWNPKMAESGHHGNHFSCTAPRFVADYVAPLMAPEGWDQYRLGSAEEPVRLRLTDDRQPEAAHDSDAAAAVRATVPVPDIPTDIGTNAAAVAPGTGLEARCAAARIGGHSAGIVAALFGGGPWPALAEIVSFVTDSTTCRAQPGQIVLTDSMGGP